VRLARLLLTVSVCLTRLGAQADVSTPLLGSVYDAVGKGIRPIYGIPGAAVLARNWTGVPRLEEAAISPGQRVALGIGQGHLQLIRLESGGARTTPVAGAMDGITRIVFSPGGDSAVLLGNGIQVLTGISNSPQLRDIGAPATDSGWAAVAISDDGKVLLSSAGDAASAVWLIAGSAMQLPLPGSIAAAAFRAGSGDAAAVTRSGDVYWIRNVGPAAEVRLIYAGDERTANPVSIYFSADGSRTFTASRSGMLAAISLGDGSANAISCNCAPSALAPLTGDTLFRITEGSESPVLLFEAGATPRTWFVPHEAGLGRRKR
jgi:hypothetical protein